MYSMVSNVFTNTFTNVVKSRKHTIHFTIHVFQVAGKFSKKKVLYCHIIKEIENA